MLLRKPYTPLPFLLLAFAGQIQPNIFHHRPIYELCNYYVLSRLLHYIPYLSPIHPGRVISTFIGISTLVEAFTANGAAYSANPMNKPGAVETGKILLKVALILQLVVISFFLWVAFRFQQNCMKSGLIAPGKEARRRVLPILISLYMSSLFIGTRTIYRTVEYFSVAALPTSAADYVGFDVHSISPMLRYEWFFWVFEASLMLCNTSMLNLRHPGKYLPADVTIFLTPEGHEIQGQGWKDNRNVLMKIADPFDFWGLVSGQDKKDRWWEKMEAGNQANADLEAAKAKN